MDVPVQDTVSKLEPFVAVIIPVLNTRAYLQQCLDSLVAQTLSEIEIICVDNGSTDGSYELLKSYAERYPNVKVIRHTEGRQGGARNVGIEKATGEYVGFVDSDDFVSPSMFERMYAAARTCHADAVVCNRQYYSESAVLDRGRIPLGLLKGGESFSIRQRPKLLRNLTVWNKLLRRELIERHQIRFPEGVFHEDQMFVIAALIMSKRITAIPDSLYFYRRGRPGSVNEYRGADCMHIFEVMRMTTEFLESRCVDSSLKDLVDEVKAVKYLQTYRLAGSAHRRAYYRRMKEELCSVELETTVRILSPSEHRQFRVVRSCSHLCYDLFLFLRSKYGALRRYVSDRKPLRSTDEDV